MSYSHPMTPFVVDAEILPDGFPTDLAFATRRIDVLEPNGQLQYLVFDKGFDCTSDPRLNHVIGSGFTLALAVYSAIRWIDLDAKKPSDYWPRLAGCTFIKATEPGNVAVQHVCLNAKGEELSRADGRAESARLALHSALIGCKNMSFEEFAAVSVVAQIQPSGAGTYGSVYADNASQDAVNAMLANAFRNNESTRAGAYAQALKSEQATAAAPARGRAPRKAPPRRDPSPLTAQEQSKHAAVRALQNSVAKILLSSPIRNTALQTHEFSVEDGKWFANIIVHKGIGGITQANALKHAYQAYTQEMQATQETWSFQDAINNVERVLRGAGGRELAEVYNRIHTDQVTYLGDERFQQQGTTSELSLEAALKCISAALNTLDGASLALNYNAICQDQLVYLGDSLFSREADVQDNTTTPGVDSPQG